MTKYLDPEVREIIISYFEKTINYTFQESKSIKLLLKLQNLTINDIIVSSQPNEETLPPGTIPLNQEPLTLDQEIFLKDQLKQTSKKILPIPESKDLANYEYIANHKQLLTLSQQRDFEKDYKSKTDNIVIHLSGAALSTIRQQKLIAWKNRIERKLSGLDS